jgi:hypothetical protein
VTSHRLKSRGLWFDSLHGKWFISSPKDVKGRQSLLPDRPYICFLWCTLSFRIVWNTCLIPTPNNIRIVHFEALRYKPECSGFDFHWGFDFWDFSLT